MDDVEIKQESSVILFQRGDPVSVYSFTLAGFFFFDFISFIALQKC